jgi:hypothetical protein
MRPTVATEEGEVVRLRVVLGDRRTETERLLDGVVGMRRRDIEAPAVVRRCAVLDSADVGGRAGCSERHGAQFGDDLIGKKATHRCGQWLDDGILGYGSAPRPSQLGQTGLVATYAVNKPGVAKARALIDARGYRVRSRWADVQPRAAEQNAFIKSHGWEEYASWHLALTEGMAEESKGHYAFVFGDFRRLHRMGLIACYYRAAEWEHKQVMLAAHDLLLYLDDSRK